MHWRAPALTALLIASSFAPPLGAQVPYGYLMVAEETEAGPRCAYANPQTGLRTDLLAADGGAITARAVSVDPGAAGVLHLLGGSSPVGTATIQGSQVLASVPVPFAGGLPARLLSSGAELLVVVSDGATPGLWSASPEGTASLLLSRPGARDLCVVGSAAYVVSDANGLSRIEEVDLSSGVVRTLGSGYPALSSIGPFVGNALLAGGPSGELLHINRFSGVAASLGNPRLGAITAIAPDPLDGLPYFSTDRGEVYRFGSFSSPVYVGAGTILDLDVGVHDLPALLFFGEGCASGTSDPEFVYADTPGLGTDFTMSVTGAPPLSGAWLVAGFSREWFAGSQPLPFPLAQLIPQVAGDCLVQTDVRASWFTTADGTGRGQISVGVPDLQGLRGLHTSWQWVLVDHAAPGGMLCSQGAEAIVR